MMVEIMMAQHVLKIWKKSPSLPTYKYPYVYSYGGGPWGDDKPMSESEVIGMMSFLIEHAPTIFIGVFPEYKKEVLAYAAVKKKNQELKQSPKKQDREIAQQFRKTAELEKELQRQGGPEAAPELYEELLEHLTGILATFGWTKDKIRARRKTSRPPTRIDWVEKMLLLEKLWKDLKR